MKNRLLSDQEALKEFQNNPLKHIVTAGIPTLESGDEIPVTRQNIATEGYQFSVEWHWWGLDFIMNPELTEAITPGKILATEIGVVISSGLLLAKFIPAAPVALIVAAIQGTLTAKLLQIEYANSGHGIHWPITWLQWLLFVFGGATPPAMLILFHPFDNSVPDMPQSIWTQRSENLNLQQVAASSKDNVWVVKKDHTVWKADNLTLSNYAFNGTVA